MQLLERSMHAEKVLVSALIFNAIFEEAWRVFALMHTLRCVALSLAWVPQLAQLDALPVEFHRCISASEDFEIEAALIWERCLVPQKM